MNYWHPELEEAPLSRAVLRESEECVRLLLSHALVDVNSRNYGGSTALHRACSSLSHSSASYNILLILCAHPDTDFNAVDDDNWTPVWICCSTNDARSLKYIFACAPAGALQLGIRARRTDRRQTAWEGRKAEDVSFGYGSDVLLAYQGNPRRFRADLRRELGFVKGDIAFAFAFMCATCLYDGYLQVRRRRPRRRAARFFLMISRLPRHLQMIICHRGHASPHQVILSGDTNSALRGMVIAGGASISPLAIPSPGSNCG